MRQISLVHEGFVQRLSYSPRELGKFTTISPSVVSIHHKFTAERRRVERFIEDLFHTKYAAQIKSHYPYLMSVHDKHDNILAALGFRYAKQNELFLENYLDLPIEVLVSQKLGNQCLRGQITEVGNLASNGFGGYIFMFSALLAYLDSQDQTVITATVTASLQRYFKRLQMAPAKLANANQERLNDGGRSWGSYYDTDPQVSAGKIKHAKKVMNRLLKLHPPARSGVLFSRLHKPLFAAQNGGL